MCTPGSRPSGVTPPTIPCLWVTWFVVPAAWTLLLAAVPVRTRRAGAVTLGPVPAAFTGGAGPVGDRAVPVVFTVTTAEDRPDRVYQYILQTQDNRNTHII